MTARPIIRPNPGFCQQLQDYEEDLSKKKTKEDEDDDAEEDEDDRGDES